MPFEQLSEYDYSNLPEETIYRFAEIEINQAIKVMNQVYRNFPDSHALANKFVYEQLFYYSERTSETQSNWAEALADRFFKMPPKFELINYFLYHHLSYTQIRKLMTASPNTISKCRFQPAPFYTAIYRHWNPEMLVRWNNIKDHLNLWHESLAHSEKEIK